MDVDKEEILTISYRYTRASIKLIYNPPCHAYPGGHFDAYVKGEVVKAPVKDYDDYARLWSATGICVAEYFIYTTPALEKYIKELPSDAGMILVSDVIYACQLKHGRVLLRHRSRQMNSCDSSHPPSCIELASTFQNASQLAKVLAEYESESRSGEVNSSESDYETYVMTSPVSGDACKLFMSSGSSVDSELYRQLVVERINDDDITTALKLCCIGHQIPFCRDNIDTDLLVSEAQILRDTFEHMLKKESYDQEKSKFLSISDEWYRVLEPRGLMNIEQRELLREWISTRQYANTEDPVVSLVIEECSMSTKEEETRKWQESEEIRREIEDDEGRECDYYDDDDELMMSC